MISSASCPDMSMPSKRIFVSLIVLLEVSGRSIFIIGDLKTMEYFSPQTDDPDLSVCRVQNR